MSHFKKRNLPSNKLFSFKLVLPLNTELNPQLSDEIAQNFNDGKIFAGTEYAFQTKKNEKEVQTILNDLNNRYNVQISYEEIKCQTASG